MDSHERPLAAPPIAPRAVAAAAVLALALVVMQPFLIPIAWAAILAYASWPLHVRLRRAVGGRATASAALATVLASITLLVPVLWISALLQDEVFAAVRAVSRYVSTGPHHVPEAVQRLPGVGPMLDDWVFAHTGDPKAIGDQLLALAGLSSNDVIDIAGSVGRNVIKVAFTLVVLFFLYRDAERLLLQLRAVARHFLGTGVERYLHAAGDMVRAVVYGVVITAVVQGAVAGIGYRLAGAEPAAVLGILTAVATVVPVIGTALVWAGVGVWMLLSGSQAAGLFLLAWGAVLVHPIDNLLRPLVVSNVARMPFLLAMFGVLGGLLAFGLAGLFLGPVILAVAISAWRELAHTSGAPSDGHELSLKAPHQRP
ncbi:MAG TPA: AI-2E family transporter [Burkholderiaceae bacterium]